MYEEELNPWSAIGKKQREASQATSKHVYLQHFHDPGIWSGPEGFRGVPPDGGGKGP